jgi:hypothetical protein
VTVKAGVTYEQTFLRENTSFGIVDPTFLLRFKARRETILYFVDTRC